MNLAGESQVLSQRKGGRHEHTFIKKKSAQMAVYRNLDDAPAKTKAQASAMEAGRSKPSPESKLQLIV